MGTTMINSILIILLWIGAIGCGLMAGIYFAFSTFIMSSLARIETPSGILAMQSINETILRSPFMPLFFGTTLCSAATFVIALRNTAATDTGLVIAACVIYIGGMFLVTALLNVPLNNILKDVDPYSAHGAEVWDHYLLRWTLWNHIRTGASLLSAILFFISLKGDI